MKPLLALTFLMINALGADMERISNVSPETKEILTKINSIYEKEKINKNEGWLCLSPVGVIRPTQDVLVYITDTGSGLYVYRIDVFSCSNGTWNRNKRITLTTSNNKRCPSSANIQGTIVTISDSQGKEVGKVDISKEENK